MKSHSLVRNGLPLLGALALAELTACGYRTGFIPTNLPPRELHARTPQSVEFYTAAAPTRPFTEVGLLSSRHTNALSDSTDEEVILGLREKAAEVGCDAVILQAESTSYTGTASSSTMSVSAQKRYRAACIVFNDSGVQVAAAPPSPGVATATAPAPDGSP